MAGFLLWIVHSLGVAALAALAGRVGAGRVRPAVQHVVWLCALACVAGLILMGLIPPGTTTAARGTAVPASATSSLAPLVIPAAPGWLSSALLGTWMIGTFWLGARLLWQLGRVRRLKRSCVVMVGLAARNQPVLLTASRQGRRARFCWCDDAAGPAMLGFGRPVIAVPRRLAEGLDDRDVERVLLHELAHVRRLDDWSALAEQLLLALLWVNPAVHWVIRGLAVSREMACDDWVIRRTAEPVAYARCLTAVAAMRVRRSTGRLVPAIAGSGRVLRRRVARAVDARTRPSERMSHAAFALAPVVTGLVGVAILALPPIVVEERGPAGVVAVARSVKTDLSPRLADAGDPQPVVNAARGASAGPKRAGTSRSQETAAEERRGASHPADPTRLPNDSDTVQAPPDVERALVTSTPNEPGGTDSALLPPSHARAVGDMLMPPVSGGHAPLLTADSDEPAWWSKASGAAGMIGSGAVSAGRATASFAKLVGGALSSPFAR